MNSFKKAEIAARDGDLRISLLLGFANWFLFLDHVPHNAVNSLTLRNFGFSGAADLFVFAGGYAAAIVYAKIALERGFIVAATRIFKRVWQLYAAYIVLFVVYVDLISYVAAQTAAPDIINEFNVSGFIDHPIRTLIYGLLLQAKPRNLEVLQLFIALMAFFPLTLFGMLRWPNLTLAVSAALYVAARVLGWSLPAYPEGTWFINPFCSQLLFVLGVWFALSSKSQLDIVASMQRFPALRIAALLYLLFALAIKLAATLPQLGEFIPAGVLSAFLLSSKENMAPYEILHFLALVFLFTIVVPRNWRGFQSPMLRPVVKCGEEWLAVFCAGVFLSFAGHFVLITGPNSIAMALLVSVAGIAIMTAVAYYVSWSRWQDYKSAIGARS